VLWITSAVVGELEECQRQESTLIARRMSAIAALLWHRTGEAEHAPCDDPGYALITGFARTCAEVSAAMNMSLMAASQMVGHAEALDTRLPKVARLLAQGRIDWRILRLLSEPEVSDAAALRYQPTAALERWIRCRDLSCCFPGCDRPAWGADIDHTIAFNHTRPSASGLTVPGNNKCYCRQHHRLSAYWVAAWKCLSGSGSCGRHSARWPPGPVLIVFSPVSLVLDGSLLVKRQPPNVAPPRVQAGDEGYIRGLISALGRRAVGDDANIGDGHEHVDVT